MPTTALDPVVHEPRRITYRDDPREPGAGVPKVIGLPKGKVAPREFGTPPAFPVPWEVWPKTNPTGPTTTVLAQSWFEACRRGAPEFGLEPEQVDAIQAEAKKEA